MRRLWAVFVGFLVALVVAGPALAAPVVLVPPPVQGFPIPPPPQVTAKTWILYDDTYHTVLAEHDADTPRPMASTTKIMTAIVALENGNPNDLVTVSNRAASIGESEIGLVAGEKIPLGMLIKAMLIRSGNDAAMAVAEHIGGSVEHFVEMMNAKAQNLGLQHTHFVNPHGLDAKGHYASARDLLTMARYAMTIPAFADAVGTRQMDFPDAPDGTKRPVQNTDALLSTFPGTIGVKTGFTFGAGLVLVSAAERGGRRLYAVVMGSSGKGGHFKDAAALLAYGFREFGVVPVIVAGQPYAVDRTGGAVESLQAQASVEALVQLAAVGVFDPTVSLEQGDTGPVLVPDVEGAKPVELTSPTPRPLPGLRGALSWAGRYWDWLTRRG